MASDNSNVTWKTIKSYTEKFKNWIAKNYTNNNVIEKIKVNGNALTPVDKAVDVKVPTKVSELTDGSDYAKKTDISEEVMKSAKELLKYEDISSTCVFKTDAMGSNGKLPKVYKNYNSIVIQWENVVIDEVSRSASYGHIKITKNSNYDYIINEGSISVVNTGIPKGVVRFFATSNIDDDYLYVSITGDMYIGELETGVDTVRGIMTFYFIEK